MLAYMYEKTFNALMRVEKKFKYSRLFTLEENRLSDWNN